MRRRTRRSRASSACAGLPTDAGVGQGRRERGGGLQGVSSTMPVRHAARRRRCNAAVPSTRYRNIYKSQQQWHNPAAADEAPAGWQEEERAEKRLQTTVMLTQACVTAQILT